MTFTVEFLDGAVRRWEATDDGAVATVDREYTPALYVAAPAAQLDALELRLRRDPKVVGTTVEERYTSLHAAKRDERTPVLRVAVERVDEVAAVAREVRTLYERDVHPPGTFRLFDVDLEPGFRYCLDTGADPRPARPLSTLRLDLDERSLYTGDLAALRVGGERVRGATDAERLRALGRRLDAADPDVLVVSHGDLVPLLAERAADRDLEFALGRRPGWTTLAGRSTYHSYGTVVHSPARYDVPGRVVVDRSNSFLYGKTGLAGLLELVGHAGKPLQEIGWASIGTVLTAIESRAARERDVLVPWNKWEPESFKSVRALHAADRGGFTFSPDVGVHENVAEVDFSSLYPNVICRHNVSPETVDCACHADRADVPGIGYAVCDERGFLPAVLQPLVSAREELNADLQATDDPEVAATLDARADALKWVLVACFGYQGYRNAKFGRIECHEAINAYAREVLLTAKETFEAAGWRVVHGIVDSLWLAPRAADPEPVAAVCERVSEAVAIPLEFERRYDWLALVPRRSAPGGALTRYFGCADGAFKVRGIECRQRGTTAFVAAAQRAMLDALADDRRPAAACKVARERLAALRAGDVDPADLVVRRRPRKALDGYDRRTLTAAVLARAELFDHPTFPGRDVRFVVADDRAARQVERVRVAFESPDRYDADWYADRLIRATESVVSPFGWDEARVRAFLDGSRNARLSRFG